MLPLRLASPMGWMGISHRMSVPGPDPGQIRLHGPEGALGRVAADVQLIDHAAAQGGIGFKGHRKYLPENYLRLSNNSEIFRHRKGR